MEEIKDMTPKLIGETYLRKATESSKNKRRYGLYECPYCGNHWEATTYSIKNKHTKSCGCLYKGRRKTHGLTSHRFYKTWKHMVDRCTNPKIKAYKDYGGRGITVCEDWLDIKNFVDWVENKSNWEEGLTLDRIDNDKGYSPENCTFSTKTIQSINQRKGSTNTSGYVGVSWHRRDLKWFANIKIGGKRTYLGYYNTALEAVQARDNYIIENNLPHKLSTEY